MTAISIAIMVVFALACLGAAVLSGVAVYRMNMAGFRLQQDRDLDQAQKERLNVLKGCISGPGMRGSESDG